MSWSRDALVERGFTGFVPFAELSPADVPTGHGVYVVLRPASVSPRSSKSAPPDGSRAKIRRFRSPTWRVPGYPGAEVVYIGKAADLSRRLTEYRRHGAGQRVGHWGGRYIWQLADRDLRLVAWQPTPDHDPEDLESRLIAEFVTVYGQRPFANRKAGRRRIASQGIRRTSASEREHGYTEVRRI